MSLLIFVHNNEVVTTVEHLRSHGDFSNLSGRCFPRDLAQFIQQDRPDNSWPWLAPQGGASQCVQAETASFHQTHGRYSLPCVCLHYAPGLKLGVWSHWGDKIESSK